MRKMVKIFRILLVICLIIIGGFWLFKYFFQVQPVESATTEWWNTNYQYRKKITISTGANSPSGGYNGYTARVSDFDTLALIGAGKMRADCDDLRIAYWSGSAWTEVNRHVIDCNTSATDVRFKLQADISPSSLDDNYYLYYGYSSAGTPTALGTTNVYLWYDDATSDRSPDYIFGRCDIWHGADPGYTAWSYDAVNDYYFVDTGDDHNGCFRRAANERDAYIEAEMYHLGCYPFNMTSGIIGRYILQSGTEGTGTESSDHYYASNRGEQATCAGVYSHDGDIMEGNRDVLGMDGADPPAIAINQWRKQALAIWGINNTNGKFWDSDDPSLSGFGPAGWPTVAPNASGTDSTVPDQEGAGDWGVMAVQDIVQARNILIRRYTEPEPTTLLDIEEEQPAGPPPSNNVSGWAWSETIGWISFNCTNTGTCGTSDYGVNIDSGTGNFSGYAWSENIGWIDFAPSSGYPAAPNYSARYDSGTDEVNGWARALAYDGGWDGWILLGDETNTWTNQVTINPATSQMQGWAWGSDVVGWIDFGYTIAGINNPPEATNLTRTDPDWCGSPPFYFFSWTYSDPDEDTENRFDFQVDNNSDFSSPEIDRSYTGLSNPSPSQNNQSVSVAISQLPDYVTYNSTTYYWQVKVYDSKGADSGWVSGGSFTTQPHVWPSPDFTWTPENPVPKEGVQFTDQSTCYDNTSIGSACDDDPLDPKPDSFFWTFQDANPANSTIQNPVTTFPTSGNKQVTLTVTDSDGYACPITKTVSVSLPLPKWKEIKPW